MTCYQRETMIDDSVSDVDVNLHACTSIDTPVLYDMITMFSIMTYRKVKFQVFTSTDLERTRFSMLSMSISLIKNSHSINSA